MDFQENRNRDIEKLQRDKTTLLIFSFAAGAVIMVLVTAFALLAERLLPATFTIVVKVLLCAIFLVYVVRLFLVTYRGLGRMDTEITKLEQEQEQQEQGKEM